MALEGAETGNRKGEIEMAKYHVTHTCGHEVEHALFGPYEGRRRRIEELTGNPCPECAQAERAEATAAANAVAAKAASEAGLPELTGSEKQIAWAETIRMKAIAEAEAAIARTATTPERQEQVAPLLAKLKAQDQARWWIDSRSKSGIELLKGMAR
jgi:hypothetical protein